MSLSRFRPSSIIKVLATIVVLVLMPSTAHAVITTKRSDRALLVGNISVSGGYVTVPFKNITTKKSTASLYNHRTGVRYGKSVAAGARASLKVPIQRGSTTLSLQSRRAGESTSSVVSKFTVQRVSQIVTVDMPSSGTGGALLEITNPKPRDGASNIYVKMRKSGGWGNPVKIGRFASGQSAIMLRTPAISRGTIAEFRLWLDDEVSYTRTLEQRYQIHRN